MPRIRKKLTWFLMGVIGIMFAASLMLQSEWKEFRFISPEKNLFPVRSNFEALRLMRDANVVIAGTCRDVEPHLGNVLNAIEKLGSFFKSFRVVIYENDSADATRQILSAFQARLPSKVTLIFETGVKEPLRTKRLAEGRNRVLHAARQLALQAPAYLVMIDLDGVNAGGSFVESLSTCFEYDDWDALFANQRGTYYDLWALRKPGDLNYDFIQMKRCNSFIAGYWEYYWKHYWKHYEQQAELVPVNSAFGGVAIYNLSSIPASATYRGSIPSEGRPACMIAEICEHVPFHEDLKKARARLFINTRFIND